jgi:hypothetical protein
VLSFIPLLFVACTSSPPCEEQNPHETAAETGNDTGCTDTATLVASFEAAIAGTATDCDVQAIAAWADSKKDSTGPWKQDVRRATSVDGDNFVAIDDVNTVATAGVPEAVIGDDGRTYLFHVNGDLDQLIDIAASGSSWIQTHGIPGLGALGLEVSDDGVTFESVLEFEVEGIIPGMVVDPDVVRAPDGTWRLYYVAMTIHDFFQRYNWEEGERHDVWLAESTDLVHWTQRPDPVIHGPFADPTVHCQDDKYCSMSSFGLDWSSSDDGGELFKYDGTWKVPGFAPEFFVLPDESLRLFYNSKDLGAPLRSFRSFDQRTFVPEEGVRMETYGEAVTVVPAPDGTWNLYYHTFKDPDDIPF